MVKLTQKELKNPMLRDSFRRIYSCTSLRPKTARHISQMCKRLDEEFKTTDEQFDRIIRKYAVKDDKGQVKPLEGGRPGSFRIDESLAEDFERECQEVYGVEVDVPVDTIPMEVIEHVEGLSPAHMDALDPFIGDDSWNLR